MKITKILFEKEYRGERTSIPISDIPKEFLVPGNNIMVCVEETFYTENNSSDGHTTVRISTYREQTEEEKKELRAHIEKLKKVRKEERRKEYLKLKKEFENE